MIAVLGMVHHATLNTFNGLYEIPSTTKQWNIKWEEKQVRSQKPLGLASSKKARGKPWNIPDNWILRPTSACRFRKEKAFLKEKNSARKNVYLTLKMGMKKDLLNKGWEWQPWHEDAKHNQQSLLHARAAKLQFKETHFHPFCLCTGLWLHEVLRLLMELPGRQCPTIH